MRSLPPYRLPAGPSSIDLELTHRCNLSCARCWLHGDHGVGDRYAGAELSTNEVLSFLRGVAPRRPRIYLGGGEPLVRSDFLAIVEAAKSLGLYVSFTTNGTLLDQEMTARIVAAGVDLISFSIDGPEEVHDSLRGSGTYAQALSNLGGLVGARLAAGAQTPVVAVNVTLSPALRGRLAETIHSVDLATGGLVDSFRIHHLWFVGPEELEAHQQAVWETLGAAAPGAAAHLLPDAWTVDIPALVDEAAALRHSRKVDFFPSLRGSALRRFYESGFRSRRRCRVPCRSVVVKPNGDVVFCPDEWIDGYILGNIRGQDLGTIWRSPAAAHFRSVLRGLGPFPGCARCSGMYWF